MIRIRELKFDIDSSEKDFVKVLCNVFSVTEKSITDIKTVHRSIDARNGVKYVYAFDVHLSADEKKAVASALKKKLKAEIIEEEKKYVLPVCAVKHEKRPIVVGFGPAGIFTAFSLVEAGVSPIIIERGSSIEKRAETVRHFNLTGMLDTETNIQFGEGGAGAFSDGKLTTLIKDRDARCKYVLETFVKFGAPEDILFESHPHIGTDKLRTVITAIREYIVKNGGEIHFDTKLVNLMTDNGKVTGIEIADKSGNKKVIETDTVFLAVGHSARDTFESIGKSGIPLERKPFSVGVRIEHKRKDIDNARYHTENPLLPAADYKLVYHTKNGRILYTFCMCPGGNVVAAASEENRVVTNGMSYHARDGENSNSALLVSVLPSDLGDGIFAGIEFQQMLESRSFEYGGGNYKAPAQTVGDFLQGRKTTTFGNVAPTYPRGVTGALFDDFLPEFIISTLRDGILGMDGMLHGFASNDAVLTAVESRSTCPIRIIRGDNLMSVDGLYPVGEGAGYAGGIMSASTDGIKCAEYYIKNTTVNTVE